MAGYRVLSLDGGGIRGVFTATLLGRVAKEVPSFLSTIDLFAGTSTGGILALGLAAGVSPERLGDLYRVHGKQVFDDSWLDDLKDLGRVTGADYDNRALHDQLTQVFGARVLADLKARVLVPAFDLDATTQGPGPRAWKAKFFHNFPGTDSDGAERVVDVAMRTSAAPTYFPSYQGFIDGGVVANNPSMAALAQALHEGTGGQRLADVRLLSLSTGRSPTFIQGERLDWGLAQWAKPLVTLMIEGVTGVADYECRQLLGERYFRLDPTLPKAYALDDVRAVPELVAEANRVDLRSLVQWLERAFVS